MTKPMLNNEQISRLDSIARVGGDKIGSALSKWTATDIITKSSHASIVHYSQLLEPSFSPEDLITAILIKVSGALSGYLIFLFDEKSAIEIVTRILHREIDSILELDDISRSVMEETGNIIGTAFLNTLAMNLNLEIYPSSPIIACDLSGAIVETIMAQFAIQGEYALSCHICFSSSNDKINGIFSMFPEDIDAWRSI